MHTYRRDNDAFKCDTVYRKGTNTLYMTYEKKKVGYTVNEYNLIDEKVIHPLINKYVVK